MNQEEVYCPKQDLTLTIKMTKKNREIFILLEKLDKDSDEGDQDNLLSERMVLNIMNKFSISETDQFEIAGFHTIIKKRTTKLTRSAKYQKRKIKGLSREREKIFDTIPVKRGFIKSIFKLLLMQRILFSKESAFGSLDFFICGMNFMTDFQVSKLFKFYF